MKHVINVGSIFQTNSYGAIRIVSKEAKGYFVVEFVDTGCVVKAHRGNIVAGKVRDTSRASSLTRSWEDTNIVMQNNDGQEFTIVRSNAKKCVVVFSKTKHMREVYLDNAKAGKVADPYHKSFLGIGYLGEFTRWPYWKKAKQLWSNMMKRCYNPADTNGYFGRVHVDTRWHCFANFLEDLSKLEGFEGWLSSEQTGIKYNLDKDLRIPYSDVYSVETCSFVLESLNKGATSRNNYYR